MSKIIKTIHLTETDISTLESILRQSTVEARTYIRAKILLLKYEGYTYEQIADKLDVCLSAVKSCVQRFLNADIDTALNDRKGRGRKPEISDSDITWVINRACERPKDRGYAAELWHPASFTRFIHSIAEEEGHPRMATVSESSLRKILKKAKMKPFKVTCYCERRDPDFETKMHDVLVIYKQVSMQFNEDGSLMPFEGMPVHTLSYDEKPGVQAIGTTIDDRPPIPGTDRYSAIWRDCECVRFGTLSLLAGIDLLTGEAIPYISETHKSSDFVHFLKMLDAKYPAGDKIRLILDKHSAHTSQETQKYLNSVPGRFEFVFTPTHGSWLNMVEGFFSKMTKQMLNGIRVSSKEELADRIYKYFDEINQVPVPYHWSYNLDDIDLEKEDISQIVYEVVNHKAASQENKDKRTPKPRTIKCAKTEQLNN